MRRPLGPQGRELSYTRQYSDFKDRTSIWPVGTSSGAMGGLEETLPARCKCSTAAAATRWRD